MISFLLPNLFLLFIKTESDASEQNWTGILRTALFSEIKSVSNITFFLLELLIHYEDSYFSKIENKSLLSHNLDQKGYFFPAGGFFIVAASIRDDFYEARKT